MHDGAQVFLKKPLAHGEDVGEEQDLGDVPDVGLAHDVEDASGPVEETTPSHAISPTLEALVTEAISGLELPEDPGDGENSQRIADLIIMADTLEHREGISHVAFNFLVSEVCQALEQGLEADYGEITQRWSQVYSRTYISKMLRGLSSGSLFQRGWHSWRDEVSGQYRKRRTFNLDRNHEVVQQVLKERWETESPTEAPQAEAETPGPIELWDAEFSEDARRFDDTVRSVTPHWNGADSETPGGETPDNEEPLHEEENKAPAGFLSPD